VEPLATVADLEKSVQRSVDPEAGRLALESASGLVRDYCGWAISRTTETFTVDGSGTTLLSLPTLHLVDVSAVRMGGAELAASPTGWTGPEEYSWSARGQLYRAYGWPDIFRHIEADVTHGYDVIPDAVRAVVLGLAGATAFNPGGSVLASKTVGAVTHTFRDAPGELTSLQVFQLSGYRLP
jgi:hypothetical protein